MTFRCHCYIERLQYIVYTQDSLSTNDCLELSCVSQTFQGSSVHNIHSRCRLWLEDLFYVFCSLNPFIGCLRNQEFSFAYVQKDILASYGCRSSYRGRHLGVNYLWRRPVQRTRFGGFLLPKTLQEVFLKVFTLQFFT